MNDVATGGYTCRCLTCDAPLLRVPFSVHGAWWIVVALWVCAGWHALRCAGKRIS